MILLSHPTGNENVRHAALALAEAGLLAEFDTCVGWNSKLWLNRCLPFFLKRSLQRRSLPDAVFKKTKMFPLREVGRLLATKLKANSLLRHESGIFCVDAIYQDLDRKVSRRVKHSAGVNGVYAYEDGALETFSRAREMGMKCFLDLPIGYWRAEQKIYQEEIERKPEWMSTVRTFYDSEAKRFRKDEALKRADTIFVMSSFVKETLALAGPLKASVKIIPLGAPEASPKKFENDTSSKKIKVIYAGSLTQRKGLSYLLDAVSILGRNLVELTLVGSKTQGQCAPLEKALQEHRWIPSLSHPELLQLMRDHDVLVLPSLFEGFGLVILEAMSQGLPVITTPNTCGPDIIQQGTDGFIVPIRSSAAIAEKIELLREHERLVFMSREAVRKAAAYSWQRYRRAIIETVAAELGSTC